VGVSVNVKILIANQALTYIRFLQSQSRSEFPLQTRVLLAIAFSPLVKSFYFSLALFSKPDGFIELGFFHIPTRDRCASSSKFS
jgi:hypothetical protein